MRLKAIVEGHGEVNAVPELLRRLCVEAGYYQISVLPSIRAHRTDFADKAKLDKWIQLARIDNPDGILILFDADDDCPAMIAGKASESAKASSVPIPCQVVAANREYEAWFLGSIESLRGIRGIAAGAVYSADPELKRDAKGQLSALMEGTASYSETADQTALTSLMDLSQAHRSCRSFRKMAKAVGQLLSGFGHVMENWPPDGW